jgi:ankyrin repeat protein
MTALHYAQGEEVARFLLEHGADANGLDFKDQTPLHRASEFGCVGAARVLLEHGADANARDTNHATPLHLASLSKHSGGEHRFDVVRLLLQYGSDIDARDDEGRTPVMRATAAGDHAVMQILSEYGEEDNKI